MTAPHAFSWRQPRGFAVASLGVVLATTTGCGLPTEVPQVDQHWIVPAPSTTIGVASLLPSGVRVLPDSSAFAVDLPGVTVTRALSADCAPCAASNGVTVPKPAFVAGASANTTLPAGVVSARLASGALQVTIQNGYNFDPLRPSASARGMAIITLANGSLELARDSVDGATTALPAGGTLVRTIALSPGVLLASSPVTISVQLTSPAGDPVQMDASRAIVATATLANVRVSSADVGVINRTVSSTTSLALGDVDATLVSHVTGGTLLLEVTNPFSVAGILAVDFTAAGVAPVSRTISLTPGLTQPSVALSQGDIQSLVGHAVTVRISGTVAGSNGIITVTPRLVVQITSRLDLTLHTGG